MIDIISIHIPKTAGRSFLSVMNSVYNGRSVAHFESKNYFNPAIPPINEFKMQLNSNTNVIHGHFRFNEIRDLDKIENSKIITWLRDPVERVISNYSFFKKRISESLNNTELQKRKNESLIEYASLENSRNRMSKFTDGLEIRDFYFIGITENFNSEIVKLGNMLNWGTFQIPRINDNHEYKSSLPLVTNREKQIIKELNIDDVVLYNNVLEIKNKENK